MSNGCIGTPVSVERSRQAAAEQMNNEQKNEDVCDNVAHFLSARIVVGTVSGSHQYIHTFLLHYGFSVHRLSSLAEE